MATRSDPTREADLIRSLAEDLALEILASYTSAGDFDDADFTSLGKAAVYLEEHAEGPGPALQELIAKVQSAAGSNADSASTAPEPPPIVGEP
jgi:hypothetical protein